MMRVTLRRRAASVAGVVVVAASSAAPAAAEASAAPRWTLAAVLSRIDGAKVIVGRWSGRVDASSTLCSGDGRGALWAGRRHWSRFTCTWTVFDRHGAVDRDVTFRVYVLSPRRFAVASGRFGPA